MSVGWWNWYYISKNISMKDIERYPERPWSLSSILERRDLSLEVALRYVHEDKITSHVSLDTIMKNRDYPWDISILRRRWTILRAFLREKSLDEMLDFMDNNDRLSSLVSLSNTEGGRKNLHTYMYLDRFIPYHNKAWNRSYLSQNKYITIEIIESKDMNAIGEWDWKSISNVIYIHEIIKYRDRKWDLKGLSGNKNICMKVIRMNLPNATGEWDWSLISSNISMGDIRSYPNEKWCLNSLSRNKNISLDILDMNLPNATGYWSYTSIYRTIDVDIARTCNNRYILSIHPLISIDVIDYIDRVGISTKWKYDTDIICMT